MEETCRQVLAYGKVTYTSVKNSISAVAEALDDTDSKQNENIYEGRNHGAYVMGDDSMDIDNLLSRSQNLARSKRKEGDA